jgi:protein ImuB
LSTAEQEASCQTEYLKLKKLSQELYWACPLIGLSPELAASAKQKQLSISQKTDWGLFLDISGTERIHSSEEALTEKISSFLRESKINEYKISVADTYGAAWAFSRYGDKHINIIDKKELRSKAADLPVAALRIPNSLCLELIELGIVSTYNLLNIPSKVIVRRFGYLLLQRLDQLFGIIPEALTFTKRKTPCSTAVELEDEVNQLPLLALQLKEKMMALVHQLDSSGLILEKLHILFSGRTKHIECSFFLGSYRNELKHLMEVIISYLERVDLNFYIQGFKLTILSVSRRSSLQANVSSLEADSTKQDREVLLDELRNTLGESQIYKLCLKKSLWPENSFSYLSESQCNLKNTPVDKDLLKNLPQQRPPLLLTKPLPITAIFLLPDNPPSAIRLKNKNYQVRQATKAERITPEWWNFLPHSCAQNPRDYFKIQDELGRFFWIYRELNSNQWFLHGIWS